MYMKKFLNLLLATPVAAVIMVACQSDEGITYSGPEYVMFSDTVYTMLYRIRKKPLVCRWLLLQQPIMTAITL